MFKVMTWNVDNLFKPGAASEPPSQTVYEKKIQGLAATINGQVPDALSLQEIGDPGALDDLVGKLSGTWHRRVSKQPDQRHIRVADGHARARPGRPRRMAHRSESAGLVSSS